MSNGHDALKDHDTSTAEAQFERAREIDGNRPEAAEALGDSVIESKDFAKAEDIFAANVKRNPGRPDAWLGLMRSLLDAEKFERVIALQQEIPSNVRLQLGQRPDYLSILYAPNLRKGMIRKRACCAIGF